MKTGIRRNIIISLFLFFACPAFSQVHSKKELIKAVHDADISFYYDEDYEKAAVQYQALANIYPGNLNLSAKLGICYLNIDGRKADALSLLKKASANIVTSDKDYIEYGDKAPLDTYLYLAVAYHQNDSLDKAIVLYTDAKKRLKNTEVFRDDYIDAQIKDCRYAIEMKKKPLTIVSDLFIPWLKDYPGAGNPVLAKNDSVFVFSSKSNGKTRIMCSYYSGTWKRPVDITKQLGGFNKMDPNSITGNGKQLILNMDDGGDGDLYISTRKDSMWTKARSLGKPVNSMYWEAFGFITPDGKTLFIVSNRPEGAGELDIWISEKDRDGKWNQPLNCGKMINTPYNENTPFYDPASATLIFSSVGHTSMGGYDVFQSIKKNGSWTNPTGLPYAYNTTTDNTSFILGNHGSGYIASIYDYSNNSRNIYSLESVEPANKVIIAKGTITLQDGMNVDPKQTQILFSDLSQSSQVINVALIDSASFKIELKPGDYQVLISHAGYKTDTINLDIPMNYQGNYIAVNASLIPEKVFGGNFLSIKNILFGYDSYKLNTDAIKQLDILKSILTSYPDLKIEVAGYTDAKGRSDYNTRLADKRAQTVIDYLDGQGISRTRFTKKAFGESDFAAVNTNRDGSDNPEGRTYNRRATFGIVDPQTGVVISQETYTPRHLRQVYSLKYSIILAKTQKELPSGYFRSLKMDEMHFIRSIKIDSVSLYVLGLFYNKNDASKYLAYAREKGFNEGYIVTQYEINNESRSLIDRYSTTRQITGKVIYTIQLKAARQPIKMDEFSGIEGVREIVSADGYYRYVTGEYSSFTKAKSALGLYSNSVYKDAFIRELNLLINR